MADIVMMEIGNSWKDLSHNDSCLWLSEALFLYNKIEKFPSLADFSHQVNSFFCFIDLVKFDDIGVI